MANRSIWNVQRRHEWLASPMKKKRLKRRKRLRIGLEQALLRRRAAGSTETEEPRPEG